MKKRTSHAKGTLLIAFLLFAVILGALLFRKYDTAARKVEAPSRPPAASSTVVALYFGAPDGKGLVREGREIEVEETLEDGVESVVDELIGGPVGAPAPTLPANLRVLGVRLKDGVAQIDFSRELKEVLASGGAAGSAAVYSVVDTVAADFPQVKAVQFLVEGAPLDDDPKGKPDLGKPVAPDYTLEQPAQAAPPAQPAARK